MRRACACGVLMLSAGILVACQESEAPTGTIELAKVWDPEFRAIVEEDLGPTGTRVRLVLVDQSGREAQIVLQENGRRWERAVFVYDENHQWFLHPVSERRPPLVFVDLIFLQIRIGEEARVALASLDWREVGTKWGEVVEELCAACVEICPLHGHATLEDLVPIGYGLRPDSWLVLQSERSPHAWSSVAGGCLLPEVISFQRVRYCAACRAAEAIWIAEEFPRAR